MRRPGVDKRVLDHYVRAVMDSLGPDFRCGPTPGYHATLSECRNRHGKDAGDFCRDVALQTLSDRK